MREGLQQARALQLARRFSLHQLVLIERRLKRLPGFGEQKAKIFLALLGKQYGYEGAGWREASAPYGEADAYRSVADITSPETLAKVRATKQAAKAAAKAAKG